jgi:hypothetical protein
MRVEDWDEWRGEEEGGAERVEETETFSVGNSFEREGANNSACDEER